MKKLIVSAIALSTLLWAGCGGDDDEDPPPPDTTVTVTADTTTAPATPLVYNDAAWNNVTATSITLSTGNSLPVSPVKTPMGPDKSLSAPGTVDLQAIKKGGRLYLRFQWDDALSLARDVWRLEPADGLNFAHDTTEVNGEDQVWVMFEGAPDGWDAWNWRVLTTAPANLAEDGSIVEGDTVWDFGNNRVSTLNPKRFPNDPKRPKYIHTDQWAFSGDILNSTDRFDLTEGDNYISFIQGESNWTVGQTVPGWYFNNEVDWGAVNQSQDDSRWDVEAVYNFDVGTGYTLVMSRTLEGESDDLDMSELSRVKTRIGVLDGYKKLDPGSSQRKFSVDFWLALP